MYVDWQEIKSMSGGFGKGVSLAVSAGLTLHCTTRSHNIMVQGETCLSATPVGVARGGLFARNARVAISAVVEAFVALGQHVGGQSLACPDFNHFGRLVFAVVLRWQWLLLVFTLEGWLGKTAAVWYIIENPKREYIGRTAICL